MPLTSQYYYSAPKKILFGDPVIVRLQLWMHIQQEKRNGQWSGFISESVDEDQVCDGALAKPLGEEEGQEVG